MGEQQPQVRRTIGYLTTFNDSDASQPQWAGVVDCAQKHDVNLICFLGNNLYSPTGFDAQANILYDLVSAQNVDALVSWTSSIGNYATTDAIQNWHARYAPLPVVTIGKAVDGIPSVMMDSYGGMRDAIVHLIEVHRLQRLVFIRGPESHHHAQERFRAYKETLQDYQIPFDENLVTPPLPWDSASGHEAMDVLLKDKCLRPLIDFQAVVAASDRLLLGALDCLSLRGVRVPEHIAAVGFNNGSKAKSHFPPITTVAVQFYQIGYQAVESACALLEGQAVAEHVVTPSRLIIRESCGCQNPLITQAVCERTQMEPGTSLRAAQHGQVLANLAQTNKDFFPQLQAGWAERLWNCFIAEVYNDASGLFLRELGAMLKQTISEEDQVVAWHSVISTLRHHASRLNDAEPKRVENLWQQARILVAETARQQMANRVSQDAQQVRIMQDIGATLITLFDLENLLDELARSLPRLGISGCYLSLYENPPAYHFPQAVPEWSRLVLAFSKQGRIALEPEGRRFKTQDLVPPNILPPNQRFMMIAEALYFQNNQLGFVLFETTSKDVTFYAALRAQISNALQGALLRQERHRVQLALETSRTQLRTIADSLPVLIAQIDTTGHYLFANEAFRSWLDLSPAQVVGRTVCEVLGEERYAAISDSLARALAGENLEIEQNLVFKQNRIRSVHTIYIPHRDADGQVDSCFELSSDITAHKDMVQQLEYLATTDEHTGLSNRRFFFKASREIVRRAEQEGTFVSLLIFDVDHFKQVNDTYGHDVGDTVLERLAHLFQAKLRTVDIFARIGGEEFSVLLPNTPLASACQVAERLRGDIEQVVFESGEARFHITISVGVACCDALHATDLGGLLKRADIALYRAKSEGRNRVVVYNE